MADDGEFNQKGNAFTATEATDEENEEYLIKTSKELGEYIESQLKGTIEARFSTGIGSGTAWRRLWLVYHLIEIKEKRVQDKLGRNTVRHPLGFTTWSSCTEFLNKPEQKDYEVLYTDCNGKMWNLFANFRTDEHFVETFGSWSPLDPLKKPLDWIGTSTKLREQYGKLERKQPSYQQTFGDDTQ
ncbi:hypothetical protein CC80DRAFT_511000 [Byssothecium circinans]|uniref:Uncharacterized protein n=1 Tax=Byssothecium circinans TaxID=147558 RepID=A0A6A5TB08_9PLEO|nr:hypothetical protein CC80DRAFT_511000 [Byssothecium circinans]